MQKHSPLYLLAFYLSVFVFLVIQTTIVTPALSQSKAVAPSIEWYKCFGGSGTELPVTVIETSDHGFLQVGQTTSTDGDGTGNHGNGDIFAVKTDNQGNPIWKQVMGGTGLDGLNKVIETSDRGFLCIGYTYSNDGQVTDNPNTRSNFAVLYLNADGSVRWLKSYGGTSYDEGNALIEIEDGFVLCGTSTSNDGQVKGHHGSTTTPDAWILKIDRNGVVQWSTSIGGTETENGSSLVQSKGGDIIVTGLGRSMDGDVRSVNGAEDLFVTALSPLDGTIKWKKVYGGSGTDIPFTITLDSNGGYFITGLTTSMDKMFKVNKHGTKTEVFLLSLDSTGSLKWVRTFGGTLDEGAWSGSTNRDGSFLITARTNSTDGDIRVNHGNNDVWLLNVSPDGRLIWDSTYGGPGEELGASGCATSDGGYIVLAVTSSNTATGWHGGDDFWLVKLGCTNYFYANKTVIHDSTYNLCSPIQPQTIYLKKHFCDNFFLASLSWGDTAYTLPNPDKDSLVVYFNPKDTGYHPDLLTIHFHSLTGPESFVDTVHFNARAQFQSTYLPITTTAARQDTIGADALLPIIIPHTTPLPAFRMYYHSDTKSLDAHGNSFFDFPGELTVGSDTIAVLPFGIYPHNETCLSVILDSATFPGCYEVTLPKSLCISSEVQCGSPTISDFMQTGFVKLAIHPNPATSSIYLPDGICESLFLIDQQGKVLVRYPAKTNKINVSHLSPGKYLLNTGHQSVGFIKE